MTFFLSANCTLKLHFKTNGVKKGVNKGVNRGYNDSAMNKEEITRIKELKQKIKALPKGYISTKNIGGSIYYYHQ